MPLKYIDFYNIIEKEMNLIQYFIKLVRQKNYGYVHTWFYFEYHVLFMNEGRGF